MRLSPRLEQIRREVEEHARAYGLNFFKTIFEVLDYEQVNEVAANGGFPTRYPHWRFGMELESIAKGYEYGLSKIYEMVINNDPCYAYLLESNTEVDQKMVMAHVYAHCDFFKNNAWFAPTNRKMMDGMANHATRIRRYMDKHGLEAVESFVDVCMSVDNLIDIHAPYLRKEEPRKRLAEQEEDIALQITKLPAEHEYLDEYINPPEFIEAQKKKLEEDARKAKQFPASPKRDVLRFLLENAPLENWERDVLAIVREESEYFAPQRMTKIMNEGWACYWHTTIMTQRVMTDSELVDYADHHSGTVASSGALNPYKVGLELYRHIEERWNKGRFGKEYEECDDIARKAAWDRSVGLGRGKIFQVRASYNDVTFIDEFLTEEFCREQKLFVYAYNKGTGRYEITDRDFNKVKEQLLFMLTNFGQPVIEVEDANYENRGELLLRHLHEGVDLKRDYAQATLENLHRIWRRPVNIETVFEERKCIWSFDGHKHEDRKM